MDLKLEVVILPVSDVDRAKQFYKGLGWREATRSSPLATTSASAGSPVAGVGVLDQLGIGVTPMTSWAGFCPRYRPPA